MGETRVTTSLAGEVDLKSFRTNPFHYSIATRVRNHYFKRFVAPLPGECILDVGCGIGYFVSYLRQTGVRVWGIDKDSKSIRSAARSLGPAFAVGVAEALPFKSGVFDKVVCSEVLEHIRDDIAAAREVYRVAKDGATIVITVPSTDGLFGAKIKNICHQHPDSKMGQVHQREGYSRVELLTLLGRANIKVVETRYTMVCVAELVMGLTKLFYRLASGRRHLENQAQVEQMITWPLLAFLKVVFPVCLTLARLEDLALSPWLKGHMLIVKAIVRRS